MKKTKTRVIYAVLKEYENGATMGYLAQKYGITQGTISKWKKKYGTISENVPYSDKNVPYSTKEVAQICGVTDECIRQNAKKVGIVMEHGKPHDWTEEELKKVQLVLMKNQVTQGVATIGGTVETNTQIDLGLGAIAKAAMNDVDAAKQFAELVVSRAQAIQEQKLLEGQNKLLLEQKEQAEAETARIYQCNRNFHSHLYTASDIAKKLGITPNMVGRIANENGLKQDPIYGKLGKIQLNNGKWVNQFYYNEDALTVIESVIG